ncbi:MAG: hypothetical protein LBD10_00420 [Desulfobulbus sp.]|jgi:hypothetical protein|uniref:hypothetical protein n=1 Tax=Desulfobulbus sp. TaxID=895 RepID=UPI0028506E03|nr:hypothetical protein [Desulfobulbus sp.]MDR2548666.1 hypothetical protein [Desulfobulbus sp.]
MMPTPPRHPAGAAEQGLKRQKYYVSRKEMVTIKCRACGRSETFSVAELKSKKHSIRVDCACSQSFEVDLEFRQDYRQKSDIAGSLRALSTPRNRARQCVIVDHSPRGLLLAIADPLPIKQDDWLVVNYRPDVDSPEVERLIRVCHYQPGALVGGTFVDTGAGRPAPSSRSNALPH